MEYPEPNDQEGKKDRSESSRSQRIQAWSAVGTASVDRGSESLQTSRVAEGWLGFFCLASFVKVSRSWGSGEEVDAAIPLEMLASYLETNPTLMLPIVFLLSLQRYSWSQASKEEVCDLALQGSHLCRS